MFFLLQIIFSDGLLIALAVAVGVLVGPQGPVAIPRSFVLLPAAGLECNTSCGSIQHQQQFIWLLLV